MQGLVMFLQNTTPLQEIKTALGLLTKVPYLRIPFFFHLSMHDKLSVKVPCLVCWGLEDMLAHFITNDSTSLALKYIRYTMGDMKYVMDPTLVVLCLDRLLLIY
jgi:hypothetical protein